MKRQSRSGKKSYDRQYSSDDDELNTPCVSNSIKTPETSERLAEKLGAFASNLVKTADVHCPDLVDFDVENDVQTIDTLKKKRAKLMKRLRHFDADGTTDINYDSAAIAGAKLAVDDGPATRNRTSKLAKEVGVNSSNLLYKALPTKGLEKSAAKQVTDRRNEDIVESFVDFQKQLKFKLNILNHVEAKADASGQLPRRRASAAAKMIDTNGMVTPPKRKLKRKAITTQRTPEKAKHPRHDPLSYTRIMDKYANELASEIKERSEGGQNNLKPIPFSLDGASDEEFDHPALF